MLAACTASQKPYVVVHWNSTTTYPASAAYSPGEACNLWLVSAFGTAQSLVTVGPHSCIQSGSPTINFPIIKVCDDTPQPQFTSEKIADMAALWGMFLLVAIVILGLRKLYNVFDKAPHGEN